MANTVEVGVVKGGLLYAVERLSAGAAEIVEVPGALVGLSVTAEQLLLPRQDLKLPARYWDSHMTHTIAR